MGIYKLQRATTALMLGVILSAVLETVEAITPAQSPLFLGVTAAKPNIMLLVDNSMSMSGFVTVPLVTPDQVTGTAYSCTTSYYYSAGAIDAATASAATAINMQVFSKSAKFCPLTGSCSSSSYTFGNSGTGTGFNAKKCFAPTKYYNVSGLGVFTGAQLNLYFKTNNGNLSTLTTQQSKTLTRLDVVKNAATSFVNTLIPATGELPTVRLGLSRYNSSATGGELLTAIGDLDSAKAAAITTQIGTFSANSSTPLAESLSDIGHYFTSGVGLTTWTTTTGYADSSKLTLTPHPGNAITTSTASQNVSAIFNSHNILNSTGTTHLPSPILGACQKSSVIILSDGLPSSDQTVSSYFQDYDGDCHDVNGNLLTSKCGSYDMKKAYAYPGTDSVGTTPIMTVTGGGSSSSDYLDDVAQALYEMDLRPDLAKATGEKNNITTYTVGFADPAIDPLLPGVNPLLDDTAIQGGGQFFFAGDTTTLADALDSITTDIISKISSSSSATANSAKLVSGAAIYQGKFDSADWTGSLSMFPLGVSEDNNGNGILDPGEDKNNNGILDGGNIGTALWNAGEHIPVFGSSPARNILTYNSANTPKGITFDCANLTTEQQTALSITSCASTDHGVWRLNFIKGDWSHEEINSKLPGGADTKRSTTAADRIFRNRTHIFTDTTTTPQTSTAAFPDPWLLGDIVNSNPVFVSNENYGYDKLTLTGEGSTYTAFVTTNASRRKMIYVGANDGMLHGFDASASGTDAGKEILAYIPNAVYSGLNALTLPSYTHQYLVDGSPRVADAYFGSAWHTMLVSTTGAGGKSVFGLDVTSPSSFGASNVLWEISDSDSPTATDLTTDTTTLRGFANNMGYTLPQPSIVKMQDGSWAAIVANGYGSVNNLAVLYIINIQTGQTIKAIDTKVGDSTTPNGLSTPIAVDTNNDKMVDTIYAGDLLGNMWKFDVSSNNNTNWAIAYGTSTTPVPLFVACSDAANCDTTRQPITSKPQVGNIGPTQTTSVSPRGFMVYFGTGKYFETIDNTFSNAQSQSFYGIWDNNTTVVKSALQSQSIIGTVTIGGSNIRGSTSNTVDYSTKKGWYIDLLEVSATTSNGERVVSPPLLRNGRIIFVTLIPIPPTTTDICGSAAGSTSWLMELDATTGKRLDATATGIPWDINGDGVINASDLVIISNTTMAPSGIQSTVGSVGTPSVVTDGNREYKYFSGSNKGDLTELPESCPSCASTSNPGRQSWRQIH